ncbi:MAG TPA: universal stress protein [Candidatus Acidoferrum sp.]|nr:universal stress protein [Candidatus Acidoferrum sp.]
MSESLFPRILVALDGSRPSRNATRHAVRLALATGGRLIFCHAVDTERLLAGTRTAGAASTRLLEAARRDGQDLMDAAGDEARAAGLDADIDLVDGNPVDALLGAAKERVAQLIVMGTHGRTGVERWELGSVAERVVRYAPCPVLTVHEDDP